MGHKPQYDENALERSVRSLTDQDAGVRAGRTSAVQQYGMKFFGDVVAKASGESFDDYVQRHIPGSAPDVR
jgi:hypothetical protein